MTKTRTIAQEVERVAVRLQLLRRMEWADDNGYVQCVTCGVVKHYKDDMAGGHYMERGKASTKLIEANINPQCNSYCNRYGMKKASVVAIYRRWMVGRYGENVVDMIEYEARKTRKYTRDELKVRLDDINKRIKEQEERIG